MWVQTWFLCRKGYRAGEGRWRKVGAQDFLGKTHTKKWIEYTWSKLRKPGRGAEKRVSATGRVPGAVLPKSGCGVFGKAVQEWGGAQGAVPRR